MPERKTVGQLMEGNAASRPGRRTTTAHEYMDLERFAEGHPAHDYLRCADPRFAGGLERANGPRPGF